MKGRLPPAVIALLAPYVRRRDLETLRLFAGLPFSLLPWSLGASAATVGPGAFFRASALRLDTAAGLALVAHEAVHVGQFRELGPLRFFGLYAYHRLRTRARDNRHPLEAPAIATQALVRTRLRDQGWP